MLGQYILEGHKPIPCDDSMEWVRWMQKGNRIVKQETLMTKENKGCVVREVKISTVFLGMDHNYLHQGSPLLFETMTFGGIENDQSICLRCSTWEEAEAQHEKVKLYLLGKGKLQD